MARRSIIARTVPARWSRYVSSRRALALRMHARTPIRFLERLQLLAKVISDDAGHDMRLEFPVVDESEEAIHSEHHEEPSTNTASVSAAFASAVAESRVPPPTQPRRSVLPVPVPSPTRQRTQGTRQRQVAASEEKRGPGRLVASRLTTPVASSAFASNIDRVEPAVVEASADGSSISGSEPSAGKPDTQPDGATETWSELEPVAMAIASTADPGPVAIAQGVDAIEIKDPDRPEPPQIAHETIAERNAEMGVTEERVPDVVAPPRESVRAAVDAATFEVQDRAEAPTATGETASRKVSAPLRGNDAAVSGPATDAPSDYTTPADNTTRADNTVNRRARVEELARVTREPQERSEGTAAAVRTPVTRVSRPAAYGSRAAEPAPPTEADELFRPVEDGMDRSPAAWMARLATSSRSKAASPLSTKTTLPATPASKRQAARAQQAVPVRSEDAAVGTPATARNERSSPHADAPGRLASSNVDKITVPSQLTQFLKPVVGVDAATVDILQGPRVAAVTQSLRAEALSIGTNTILVGREFDGRSAHDAGVLAHELTHIGRAREPRFVPPVIRRAGQRARGVETEEALATHVEADVVAAAETRMNRAAESGGPDLTRDQVMTPITVADEVRWGSLPAPWEPLPTWIGADPDVSEPTRRDHTAALGGTPLPSIAAEPTTAVHQRASVPASKLDAPLALHAADESRIVDHSPATSAAPGGADSSSPEQNAPDLDVLARQVYAVLKRRLEFETRREQLF